MILSVVIVVNTYFPITVIYVTGQDDPCDLQRILWKSAVAAHQGLQDLLQANESPPILQRRWISKSERSNFVAPKAETKYLQGHGPAKKSKLPMGRWFLEFAREKEDKTWGCPK